MRRFTAAAIALVIAAMPVTGCNRTNKTSNKQTSKTAEERLEESYEEAFTAMFDSTYARNGAENCLSYMYPKIVLDHLKNAGRYDELVESFNLAQNSTVTNMKNTPEITKFNDSVKLTDEQLKAASNYFVVSAADDMIGVGLDPAGINITEGYELHYELIDQNGNPDTDDNECVVYIENDGWKVISVSAQKLQANYPTLPED